MHKLTVFTVLVLLAAAAANAVQITQVQTYGGEPLFSEVLTFEQFDDNGGAYTLNSIQIKLTLNANGGQFIFDNDGPEPVAGNWEFGAKGIIHSTDVTLLNSASVPVTAMAEALHTGTFALAANTGDTEHDYDPSAPDGMQYDAGFVSDTQADFVGSASWTTGTNGFLGIGSYDINLDVFSWLDCSAGSISFTFTPVLADGDVTIVYDYTVPEPATMVLLGLGIVFLRKKKIA
ncbi:MAG: PEP-CTERM sorting domain-containing protein [Anaerohalosphaeraceae bacterium]|nr:PEP-CTERM sorting domain-containing protein [Anaerohalosphaeraceae bacterium]